MYKTAIEGKPYTAMMSEDGWNLMDLGVGSLEIDPYASDGFANIVGLIAVSCGLQANKEFPETLSMVKESLMVNMNPAIKSCFSRNFDLATELGEELQPEASLQEERI